MAQLAPVTVALAVGREWLPLAERMREPKPGLARREPQLALALPPVPALERAPAQELASERALGAARKRASQPALALEQEPASLPAQVREQDLALALVLEQKRAPQPAQVPEREPAQQATVRLAPASLLYRVFS